MSSPSTCRGYRPKTRAQAQREKAQAIKVLRRHAGGNPGAKRLAVKLAACRTGQRCRSPACPMCNQRFQATMVKVLRHYSRELREPLRMASLVVAEAGCEEGML